MATTGQSNRFEGKATLITGAASGMGRSCSLLFASEGASVIGFDVNEEGLAETAQLVSEAGGKFESGLCNVSSRDACFAGQKLEVTAIRRVGVVR